MAKQKKKDQRLVIEGFSPKVAEQLKVKIAEAVTEKPKKKAKK